MSEVNGAAAQETTQPADAQETKPTAENKTTPAVAAAAAPAATETKPSAESETKVVPEKYDLKLSENSVLDEAAIERTAAYAKRLGLTQQEASDFLAGQEEDVAAFVQERKAVWKKQVIDDPVIGGEHAKESVALAHRVIQKYADPDFIKELDRYGYGDHPHLVRIFVKIGKEMANDKAIHPGSQDAQVVQKPTTEIFYPAKQAGA